MGKIRDAMQEQNAGLIFANLVDFDMLYGHRKDVEGFARSLEEFDALLGAIMPEFPPSDLLLTLEEYERWRGPSRRLKSTDLLLITADHGCDPDDCSPSTDHSREYVPIVAFSPSGNNGANLGTRATLADIGQTVAENFGARIPHGESFLAKLLKK
jgi:phosphopentomutase